MMTGAFLGDLGMIIFLDFSLSDELRMHKRYFPSTKKLRHREFVVTYDYD